MKAFYKLYGLAAVGCALLFTACDDDDAPAVDFSQIYQVEDFVDARDNHTYRCVQIGDQIWMMDNLSYYLPLGAYEGCYTWNEQDIQEKDITVTMTNDEFKVLYNGVIDDPVHDWEAEIGVKNTVLKGYISNLDRLGITGFVNMFKSWKPAFYQAIVDKMDESKFLPTNPYFSFHTLEAEEDNGEYSKTYGYLYSLEAARRAVPEGWRIPTDQDWMKLEAALGMSAQELGKLNEWRGEGCGDLLKDKSLFEAKMAGCNSYTAGSSSSNGYNSSFIRLLECAYFWTDEEKEIATDTTSGEGENVLYTSEGIVRQIAIFSSQIWRGSTPLKNSKRSVGYSVRCVKDAR